MGDTTHESHHISRKTILPVSGTSYVVSLVQDGLLLSSNIVACVRVVAPAYCVT